MKRLQEIKKELTLCSQDIDRAKSDLETFSGSESITERLKETIRENEERAERLLEERRLIIRGLDVLPEKQRNVLLLHYDAGLTWSEVAAAMGLSIRWVYRLRGAAIDKRRTCNSDPRGNSEPD